jgi:hypothetical protein
MKVGKSRKNVCLASMLTPQLAERKYFNQGTSSHFVLIRVIRGSLFSCQK